MNGNIDNIFFRYDNKVIEKNESNEIVYIKEPKSFATDDWETISKNVKAGNISKYNVGDTKTIKLISEDDNSGNEDGIRTREYRIRIANTTNTGDVCTKEYFEYADGTKEKYSKTACGFVIEFEEIIAKHNMNPEGEYKGTQYNYGWNVDGYPASSMRTYVNNEVYNTFPGELKKVIIPTIVVSGHGSNSGEKNFTTTDNIYLLSGKEIYGVDLKDTSSDLTRQLDYYKNYKNADGSVGVTLGKYSGAIKKQNGNASYWWLRSAYSLGTGTFRYLNKDGYLDCYYAKTDYGVAVAFRIG